MPVNVLQVLHMSMLSRYQSYDNLYIYYTDQRNVGENSCNSGDRRDQTGPVLDVDDDDDDDVFAWKEI